MINIIFRAKLLRGFILLLVFITVSSSSALWAEDNEVSLKNPELIKKYTGDNEKDNGEYFTINLLVAGISGATFGYVSSYSMVNQSDHEKYQYLFAGGFALGSMALSAGISTVEIYTEQYYRFSMPLFRHSWLGFIIGSASGAVYSMIPYSDSRDSNDILQYTGYGAAAGVGLGILSGLITPFFSDTVHYEMNYNPAMSSMNFQFVHAF